MTAAASDVIADVAVVGDGPAGRALAAACAAEGVETILLGGDRPWSATYASWVDDVAGHSVTFATQSPIDVVTNDVHRLARVYGVFDNDALRRHLSVASHVAADVVGVEHHRSRSSIVAATGERFPVRLVLDATGSTPVLAAAPAATRTTPVVQSAYGLVVPERPPSIAGDAAVLMDWTPVADGGDATFLYVVPLAAGRWLVEETSLARRGPIGVEELRRRLSRRLGHDPTAAAEHVEHVLIPMAHGVPSRRQRVVAFGAAGGYVHPATGYSVAASMRAAPRVATAIAAALSATSDPQELARAAWDGVWPDRQRHARALHDYGSSAVLRMTPEEIRAFFEAFFALPSPIWTEYLRVDTTATDVAAVMRAVFSSVPWRLRRRLAAGSPSALAGLLR